MKLVSIPISFAVLLGATFSPCLGYDYEGHRLVNQLALAALPAEFPGFVKMPANRERIAFLGGEPDRWRNSNELSLQHVNALDHFINLEDLAEFDLNAASLSGFRYEFVAHLARVRAARPERFAPIDPTKDLSRTRGLPGFLPWTITEYYGKLKSVFSYLKTFEEAGTPEEIANARENVLYIMGTMGHFVADVSQPLHTTRHYNGWVGNNPAGYTTNRTFHSWIDGGYLEKVGMPKLNLLQSRLRPAQLLWPAITGSTNSPVFATVMQFVLRQHRLVEPLYRLEKEGKLSGDSALGRQGKAFLETQILEASQLLADLWYSAWREAPPDRFLQAQLAKRKLSRDRPAREH